MKQLPKTTGNFEDGKQLVRSSGSVGANYIEANEAVSKKDFIFRIKICRKEAKESCYSREGGNPEKHWMPDQARHDGDWLFSCRVNMFAGTMFCILEHLIFEFVSDFDIRISGFIDKCY